VLLGHHDRESVDLLQGIPHPIFRETTDGT
jgi:hypothetical protein